mgnify:FL=1
MDEPSEHGYDFLFKEIAEFGEREDPDPDFFSKTLTGIGLEPDLDKFHGGGYGERYYGAYYDKFTDEIEAHREAIMEYIEGQPDFGENVQKMENELGKSLKIPL